MIEPELPDSQLSHKDRRRAKQLAAVPVVLALAAYIGQILTSSLVTSQPLVLISLNATDPMLLLAANQSTATAFLIVGSIRLFAPDLFLHQLGWEFGPATKSYLKNELGPQSGILRSIAALERWFPRVGWIMLFLIPGYPMCLLAGITRMKRLPFILVNLAGTFCRLLLIFWVSSVFNGPLGTVIRFIGRYSLPFTLAMFLLVALQTRRRMNNGSK
ncbi:MAG: hypothetical protein CBE30_001550 [Actinobacteria bacterium TMED270]|nr:MAG: hypothetical protein CBE30_001550 [Actinobacteria bacterium TMED270]|tara:strand:- start:45 stop:692 length:648 start_codon:yes stop_codon:yes gene_type:complete